MFRKTLTGIALLALLAPVASAQTVDELIAKNIEAKGGMEKIKAVQSTRATGRMMMGPMEIPMVMVQKRPKNFRMEFTFQGMSGIQAFDGKTAWASMPMMGKKEPEAMSGEEAKQAEEQGDMDGPLVDYQEKGNTVELVGKEQVEGADAYKLKCTLKDGDVRHIYLDAETYLEIKVESKRMIRGTEIEGESYMSDYKEVDGMMMPFAIESGAKGNPQRQKIVIDKVEINPELADSLFAMPAVAAASDSAAAAVKGAAEGAKDAGKAAVKAAESAGAKVDSSAVDAKKKKK